MQQIFEFAGVSFESSEHLDVPTFGIIKLHATTEPNLLCRNRKIEFHIRIDNSGSMSDLCSDGRTKMQHVNFTVCQILRKVSQGDVLTEVDIKTFDESIVPIVSSSVLNLDTVDEMVCKVNKIFPNGGTDIFSVLKLEASEEVKPGLDIEVDRVFILLSDGQDTTNCGRNELIRMSENIAANTHVIMIGVGNDHDSTLFKGIVSKRVSGHYTPVSNVEDISIAMSELVYGILNKILKRPTITVSNGEIYNWATNKWVTCTNIDDIVIGRKKTFNVRSSNPSLFTATVEGTLLGEKGVLNIMDIQYGVVLTYDKYRHRTMELIGEAATADKMSSSEVKELKRKLKNMMVELKAYMDENNLRDDKHYQVLCDDIFMCHQTMGMEHGIMYATARQVSQGTQSIYTNQRDLTNRISAMHARGPTRFVMSQPDDDGYDILPPVMARNITRCISKMNDDDIFESLANSGIDLFSANRRRQGNQRNQIKEEKEEDEEEDDTMANHKMMENGDSPYANPTEIAFIRDISSSTGKPI